MSTGTLQKEDFQRLALICRNTTPVMLESIFTHQNLEALTVQSLKSVITYLRITRCCRMNITGRKSELIERIKAVVFPGEPGSDRGPGLSPLKITIRAPQAYLDHSFQRPRPPFPSKNSYDRVRDPRFRLETVLAWEYYVQGRPLNLPFVLTEEQFSRLRDPRCRQRYACHVRCFRVGRERDQWFPPPSSVLVNHQPARLHEWRKIRVPQSLANPFFVIPAVDISNQLNRGANLVTCHNIPVFYTDLIIVIELVQEVTIDALIATIPVGEQHDMNREQRCDEIEEVNRVVSLRCPLSYSRILVPGKGKNCQHAQAFCLKTYIEFSLQQLHWHCPVCHRQAHFGELVVDPLFQTILKDVAPDVMRVEVNTNGTYSPVTDFEDASARRKRSRLLDESAPSTPGDSSAVSLAASEVAHLDAGPSKPIEVVVLSDDE